MTIPPSTTQHEHHEHRPRCSRACLPAIDSTWWKWGYVYVGEVTFPYATLTLTTVGRTDIDNDDFKNDSQRRMSERVRHGRDYLDPLEMRLGSEGLLGGIERWNQSGSNDPSRLHGRQHVLLLQAILWSTIIFISYYSEQMGRDQSGTNVGHSARRTLAGLVTDFNMPFSI
ncbi:hypothetical protein BDQ17DRAFT_1330348 [Cyathus striatus]|nr:hypothetical protein BDQ17DRAFT_1330348 [Cyathus striatus]